MADTEDDIEETEVGFDLDKIEIPPTESPPPSTVPADTGDTETSDPADTLNTADTVDTMDTVDTGVAEKSSEVQSETASKGEPKKEPKLKHALTKTRLRVILPVAVIALVAASFFIWNQVGRKAPLITDARLGEPSDFNVSIGPVTTNAGETGRIIRMTVEVICDNPESKKRVSKMASLIKDRIVISMSSPDAAKIISRKDFEALKSYLVGEISNALEGNSIERAHVDFSEFSIS
jgi:flagellar basal body-associated protein FliL